IGLPKNMNGTIGERGKASEVYAEHVEETHHIPTALWDERLSTIAAERVLLEADMSRSKRKKVVDKVAAVMILQGYLDQKGKRGEIMALEEKERIIIPDENGEEHLFEVLFTFDVEETKQAYIALTPVEQQANEEVEVYAFRYEEKEQDDDDLSLFPIESDEEWEIVEEMLHTLADEEDAE